VPRDIDVHAYAHDLERHLRRTLFGGGLADPEGAVLLVRGALAGGDPCTAAELTQAARRLASVMPECSGMAAAADHARGLIERDPATLERAAAAYPIPSAQASALEDAGDAWSARGERDKAAARLTQAHRLYEQLGLTGATARVRSRLREDGVRLRHWTQANRPAHGWGSLTDTERLIASLVAQGLSNRQEAGDQPLSVGSPASWRRG
jgi:hypothetical protein